MILTPITFERLHEINERTLQWFARELEPDVRTALARCPFALFDARFYDSTFWEEQREIVGVQESHVQVDSMRPWSTQLADVALFFAWHLAHSSPAAARISLGMADGVVRTLQAFRLDRIQALASEHPNLVALRWGARSPYWTHLIRVVQKGSVRRIEDMRSLGLQLMAARVFRETRSPAGRP